MKKLRVVAITLAIALLTTGILTSCTEKKTDDNTQTPTTSSSSTNETKPHIEVSVFRGTDMSQSFDDSMFVDYVKEKFNLTLKYEYNPSSSATEKLNLAFATNTYPDMIDVTEMPTIQRLAKDGFLLPLSDYMDKLPDYRKAFKDADWDIMVQSISNAKGKFYLLPQKYAESATGTFVWMYRAEEFQKAGLSLPKTTDDFFDAMVTLKKSNPNLTLPNRWGLWNALEGFNLAFRVQYDAWLDPDANDVVYGPATDKFRDLVKYMNKLFTSNILSKEFVTMSSEQRTSEFTKGNVYANFQFAGAENALNSWQESAGLPEDWVWQDDYLLMTAYPDKKPMRQNWPKYMSYGVALTDKISDEARERLLEYLNWSCTEEGQIFHEFGVEGKTYEMKDGVPEFLPTGGPNDETYEATLQDFGPFGYYLIQNEALSAKNYPLQAEVNKLTDGFDECDFNPIPLRLTPDEESTIAEIGVVLTQTRDEWVQGFVMGTKDPNDDSQWNQYITKLKDAGLDEYVKIMKDGNARLKSIN